MKKGDMYKFKGGYMLCTILNVTTTKVKYQVVLGTFENECSTKDFLKTWELYKEKTQ